MRTASCSPHVAGKENDRDAIARHTPRDPSHPSLRARLLRLARLRALLVHRARGDLLRALGRASALLLRLLDVLVLALALRAPLFRHRNLLRVDVAVEDDYPSTRLLCVRSATRAAGSGRCARSRTRLSADRRPPSPRRTRS